MYASITNGVLTISPDNKLESYQIKSFYKRNKGKAIETVILFETLTEK